MIFDRNQVMEKSNLTSMMDNHDYDGDSLIAVALHSVQAKKDAFDYMHIRNLIEKDHSDELLIDYEHESIYSAYCLTINLPKEFNKEIKVKNIYDIQRNLDSILNDKNLYVFGDTKISYIEFAINFTILDTIKDYVTDDFLIYTLKEDGPLTKRNLKKFTKKINDFLVNNKVDVNFWDVLHHFNIFLLECSTSVPFCVPSFKLEDFVINNKEIEEFKSNLIEVEPFIAFHQNLILFDKIKKEVEKDEDNFLNIIYNSGARLKSVQLLKASSNLGIPTDIYGKAFSSNIKNSLLDGPTEEEYFKTGDSARLALAQRQDSIPKGGELQRKFFFTIGLLKLNKDMEDCKSDKYLEIFITSDLLKTLNHRYYLDEESNQLKIINIEDKSLINKTLKLRSPVTCKCPEYKICKTCFGEKRPETANLGAIVGSSIAEGIIQSVLRTHHFGGAFIANENYELLNLLKKCSFKNPDIIISDKVTIDRISKILIESYYDEKDINIKISELDDKYQMKMEIFELPQNDDSVKVLNNIVKLIDKERTKIDLIPSNELFERLSEVVIQNNLLAVYIELIISLLYYDEDGLLLRYSEKEADVQIALKNIIEMIDPKASIFYNFTNRIISKIYTKNIISEKMDHMYNDLLECYK